MMKLRAAAAPVVLLWLGCGGAADKLVGAPAAGGHADAAVDAATQPVPEAGSSDAAAPPGVTTVSNDGAAMSSAHTSFETAQVVAVDDAVLQLIAAAGEATYFMFEAEAGEFYLLTTENSPFSPENALNLFDADRQLIAHNGAGSVWPGDYVDTRLVFRAPHAGRYYVRVADDGYPAEVAGQRFSSPLSYHLQLRKLTDEVRGFAKQAADGETKVVQLLSDENGKHTYATVFGALARGQSAHFELAGQPGQALIGQLHPAGVSGNGSSATALHVTVLAQPVGHALASVAQHEGYSALHPPVDSGTYQVKIVQDADAGDNGFYAVDLVLIEDNPKEQAEEKNGELAGAEPLELTGSLRRRGRVLSRLAKGDVDFYRFELAQSEQMFAVCEGESGGSGVRGLQATLLDASEKPLRMQREPSGTNLVLDPVRVDKAGTYFLKLQADAPAKDGSDEIEPWVRCAVTAGP